MRFGTGKSRDVLCCACRTARRDTLVTTGATRTTRVQGVATAWTGVDMSSVHFTFSRSCSWDWCKSTAQKTKLVHASTTAHVVRVVPWRDATSGIWTYRNFGRQRQMFRCAWWVIQRLAGDRKPINTCEQLVEQMSPYRIYITHRITETNGWFSLIVACVNSYWTFCG